MKEAAAAEVTLQDVEVDVLEALLDYIYKGNVSIDQENVQSIMAAANLFQVRKRR